MNSRISILQPMGIWLIHILHYYFLIKKNVKKNGRQYGFYKNNNEKVLKKVKLNQIQLQGFYLQLNFMM